MKVKGPALIALQSFVLSEFGMEDGYKKWFENLTPESQKLFLTKPNLNEWYSLKDGLNDPTQVMCNLFYKKKMQGAWEAGRFSADFALNTLMKIFIKASSVRYMARLAAKILSRYYEPANAEVVKDSKGEVIIRITEFEGMTVVMENRIGGYIERSVELTGGRNVEVFIGPSMTKASPYTEYKIHWK